MEFSTEVNEETVSIVEGEEAGEDVAASWCVDVVVAVLFRVRLK